MLWGFLSSNAPPLGRLQAGFQRLEQTGDSWGGPGTCMQVLDGNLISKQEMSAWELALCCCEREMRGRGGVEVERICASQPK